MEPHRLLRKRTDHVCGLLPLDGYNITLLEDSVHGPYCAIDDAMSAYG